MNRNQWIESAEALLHLDEKKALVPHGIGGHARTLLEEAVALLRAHNSDSVEPVAWVFELARARFPETGEYTDWGPAQLAFTEPCVPDGSVRNLKPLYLASPPAKEVEIRSKWYLGSQNDGLFIIDTPPRPSNDDPWHDRPDGPSLVIPVWQLPTEVAQKIVDAHNLTLTNRTPDDEVRNGSPTQRETDWRSLGLDVVEYRHAKPVKQDDDDNG